MNILTIEKSRIEAYFSQRPKILEGFPKSLFQKNGFLSYEEMPDSESVTGGAEVVSKIAVLELHTAIFRKADYFSAVMGFDYSVRGMIKKIKALEQSEEIAGLVLDIDSPGGDAIASAELAEAVQNFSKPTAAVISGSAFSGAYWVASAADKVFFQNESVMVGSIGALYVRENIAGYLENAGIKIEVIRADGSEDKARPYTGEELTDDLKSEMKRTLNPIRNQFADFVKSQRPEVSGDALTGKIYIAEEALALSLVDEKGGLPEAVFYLNSNILTRMENDQKIKSLEERLEAVAEAQKETAKAMAEKEKENQDLRVKLAEKEAAEAEAEKIKAEAEAAKAEAERLKAENKKLAEGVPAASHENVESHGAEYGGTNSYFSQMTPEQKQRHFQMKRECGLM